METRSISADNLNPGSSASFVDQLRLESSRELERLAYGLVISREEQEILSFQQDSGFRPIGMRCESRCESRCNSCASCASYAIYASLDSVYSVCPTPKNPYNIQLVSIIEFFVEYIKDPQRIHQFANVILDIMSIVKNDRKCITVLGNADDDILKRSFQTICWGNLDDGTLQQVFNTCKNHISLQECFCQGTRQDWWPIWANNY